MEDLKDLEIKTGNSKIQHILDYNLINLGDIHLKVSSLVTLFIFLLLVYIILKIIKKSIYSVKRFDEAKKYSFYSLLKYFLLVIVAILSLQIIGINMSVLIAGSAALLVGLGLGIQNLFSDYISGIIILIDSTVKVDDVIDIDGLVCRVQTIRLRTTTVLTRDDKYIIVPNSDLTRNQLINWTHSSISSRFDVNVGVDYSSDVPLVMQLLKESAIAQEGILKTPSPFVRFNNYGDSSIDFTVYFWVDEVFRVENIKSNLRIMVFEKFRQNSVSIPFPQHVIHTKQDS